MEKKGKDKTMGVLRLSLKSTTKWLYLNKNSINLSYTVKENGETY